MLETLSSTRVALEKLAGEFEPRALSGAQAVRVVSELGAIRRLTDGILGRAARRVDETAAHVAAGARDAAHLYAREVGAYAGEARRVITTARQLEHLPETAAAVCEGRLSARQAELVADAATQNPLAERMLLDAAADGMIPLKDACVAVRAYVEDPAARAARQHAARRMRTWMANDGMLEGHFRLPPELGGGFKAMIDGETQAIFRSRSRSGRHESHEAYAADALMNLMTRGAGGTDSTAKPSAGKRIAYTVHVVIDHAVLVRGNVCEGETCTIPGVGPVNAAWVREVLGEAFLTAVIKKGRDITSVSHFGRHVPAELQTAMIVGGRECDIVGCHGRAYLERDHWNDYAKGGPTAWWNLVWLCSVHHRRKTKGWKLSPRDPNTGRRTLEPPAVVART